MSELLVITGLSGAGRSQAANAVEDLGWHVIDNVPLDLLVAAVDLAREKLGHERIGLSLPAGADPQALAAAIQLLRGAADHVRVLFLDAATETLVRRYESTRRRHPFGVSATLSDAIEAERSALAPARMLTDVVIDTTDLNVHQLRERMEELFGSTLAAERMRTTIVSFGFTHGLPRDVDLVFDCRFLPNPHWIPDLRPHSGLDAPVREYVFQHSLTGEFVAHLTELLRLVMPAYIAEGKSYLTVAFGCTGGRHRSVAIAEHMAELLRTDGYDPVVVHRDVDR